MAVKGDGSETEVVLFAARPVCCSSCLLQRPVCCSVLFAAASCLLQRPVCCGSCLLRVLFAAASRICPSRTRLVVEPDSAHFRKVFYLFGNFFKKDIAFIF
jgi:hypothetical protein